MTSPTFKDNNWLSSARALNAAEFLIENNNLDPRNLKYSGRGSMSRLPTILPQREEPRTEESKSGFSMSIVEDN